jgi:hypothetical protein
MLQNYGQSAVTIHTDIVARYQHLRTLVAAGHSVNHMELTLLWMQVVGIQARTGRRAADDAQIAA